MKDPTFRPTPRRQTPLLHKATRSRSPPRKDHTPGAPGAADVNDSLAICLFGLSRTMYDSEYEEEIRKQAVMSEVLPDAKMWEKWEKTEAPLRQGRGWYPALDRHFLELLVMSEIHCLSHPLHGITAAAGQAERIHRHACRVRRVACERIGAERLHAYCERVKEAFEAYVHCGWGQRGPMDIGDPVEEDDESVDTEMSEGDGHADALALVENDRNASESRAGGGREEERGRTKERGDGSVNRDPSPGLAPPLSPASLVARKALGGIQEGPGNELEDKGVEYGLDEGELMKIDLDDVDEDEEEGEAEIKDGMDIDIVLKHDSPLRVQTPGQEFPVSPFADLPSATPLRKLASPSSLKNEASPVDKPSKRSLAAPQIKA